MRKRIVYIIIFCLVTISLKAQEPIDTASSVPGVAPLIESPVQEVNDTSSVNFPAIEKPTLQETEPTTNTEINTKPPIKPEDANKLITRFAKQVVEFEKGELIANVFIVTNNLSEKQKFYIDFTIPTEWKVIANNHKLYELEPGDSLIVPVHIVPREKFKGSTRFMFYAFLSDEKGKSLGMNYFYGLIKKHIRWALTVSENKYYLPNNVSSIPFTVGLINESTDEQDLFLTASSLKKNVIIKDSSNTKEEKFPKTFSLLPNGDTLFYFTFNKFTEPRNFKMIDAEDYIPFSKGEAKKYKLFFNSSSPNPAESNKFRSGKTIDFIELSDSWEVNRYSGMVVPLIVDANMYNILGEQPMMTLNLRGDMFLQDSSMLLYQAQLTYFSNYFSTIPYQNAVYSLGYYHRKFHVNFGNINSGLLGTYQVGKGLKGEYYIAPKHRIGAFYVGAPELFRFMPKIYSFGLNHFFENKIIRTSTIIGRNVNQQTRTTIDAATLNVSIKAIKNHSFGVRLGGTQIVQSDSNYTKYGYMTGVFYNGNPIKHIWNIHLNGTYTSPSFGVLSNERLTANMGNRVTIRKQLDFYLQNNFYRYQANYQQLIYTNYYLNNQLNISRTNQKSILYNPYIFYNLSHVNDFDVHSRGIGLNISNYQLDKNIRYFFNLRSGYNRAIDTTGKDYFFAQTAFYIHYRTLTFLVRYTLGSMNFSKQSFFADSKKNPQTFGLSSRYQYQFKHPSFVYQQLASYSFSTISGNQVNFTPEFYYYTYSGWRFRLFTELNFSKRSNNSFIPTYYYINNPEIEIEEPKWNRNLYIGLGVRKEFGIPVPFVKPSHGTVTFIAFYDINGNGRKEPNETVLENVVIRVHAWEVMTNEKGECTLKNVPIGTYPISAFSVVDLKGWFPNISDTININKKQSEFHVPFTRGVKISGRVFIQRDPNSPTADFKLDVSRIKIVASNHKTYTALTDRNGYYELYLPAGKYTLSMDESILGNRLQLMQNHFELDINDKFDNLFIPFYIVEKARKLKIIRFDSQGNRIDE